MFDSFFSDGVERIIARTPDRLVIVDVSDLNRETNNMPRQKDMRG
jgi:hypothetical protein